jgi:hypothetical protein
MGKNENALTLLNAYPPANAGVQGMHSPAFISSSGFRLSPV